MPKDYDIVIAGAGLAGTCSALHLANRERILLVDSGNPPGGATAAAAGLVNPFMARKARPAWRHREALDALKATLQMTNSAHLFRANGVLRPARDLEQAAHFKATAASHSECRWLTPPEAHEQYPEVRSPHGCLMVASGGAVGISAFIEGAHTRLRQQGVSIRLGATVSGFIESSDGVVVEFRDSPHDSVRCTTLLLACGAGFRSFPCLESLGLHAVKGQTADVRPRRPLVHLPHIAGAGYAVVDDFRVTIGSSFEHDFTDQAPDPEVGHELIARAAEMLPSIANADVIGHHAGLRVSVAGHRLPILGPVPGHDRVWTFTGLGSKGLLMAPLIAKDLPAYLDAPGSIPPEIRISG
ncbi:MAG: FAD-binding oxidoreductase [Rhodothermales bacterium]|nr:FAD-binding oxidoreductase [Rhodothermales bacterium]